VMDLADGHVAALAYLAQKQEMITLNLGTGIGYSVLQVVKAFSAASGRTIPYEILPRRAGDVAVNYANADAAMKLLGWRAVRDLNQMCADSWRWQLGNPNGFDSSSKP